MFGIDGVLLILANIPSISSEYASSMYYFIKTGYAFSTKLRIKIG
jgi:hypothetical protein